MRILMNILGYLLGAVVIAAGLAALIVGGINSDKDPKVMAAAGRICPPVLSLPARVPTAAPDDVAGVRIGHNAADMEAVLLCADESYKFRSEPVWHTMSPSGARTERQIIYAERPGDRISAGFAGVASQETIVALWREQTFGVEVAPLKADAERALVASYGPAHIVEETRLRRILSWAYDPTGAPFKSNEKNADIMKQIGNWVSGSIVAPTCLRQVRMTALEPPTFNTACGITIRAEIEGRIEQQPDAALKTSSVKIAVVDQARAHDLVAQYRASHP